MSEQNFPPAEELLPHGGRMNLIDCVLSHEDKETVCRVDPAASVLFADDDGSVPAWVGLEYMAQTTAAHGGLLDRAQKLDTRPGLFLGSRRLEFHVERFAPGRLLRVRVRHLRGLTGLIAFEGEVCDEADGTPLVSGILNVYLMDSFEALETEFGSPQE